MPIQFTCPHCGVQTNVSAEFAGHSGPCAHCGKNVTVPLPAAPSSYAPVAKDSSRLPGLIVVIITAVGVIVWGGGILISLFLPADSSAPEAGPQASCLNNLFQIGLAFQNHESAVKRFPSAYGTERKGLPESSWRVHILPYLERGPLYDQYDFEAAWDDPPNLALAAMMPTFYRCPSDSNTSMKETSYVAIVGPNTAMPPGGKLGIGDIADGGSRTLMVTERHDSGITWTEPRDLDAGTLNYRINPPDGSGLQGPHPGGINAVFCDGSVRFISDSMDPAVLEALTTRDGGEDVRDFP